MGQFLHAAYQLRIKDMYTDVKEKIPNKLDYKKSFYYNRIKITTFLLPWVRKAYREGVDYGVALVKQRFNQIIKKDYTIDSETKNKLLSEFIQMVKNAEKVFETKKEGYQKIKNLHPGPTKREDPRVNQIWGEYVNAVKAAANNLLIRSGDEGIMSVYRRIE